MKRLLLVFFLLQSFTHITAQEGKKKLEYAGTKVHISYIGKNKMFSEGAKKVDYQIIWNQKKSSLKVNAGPRDKWYEITITGKDNVNGDVIYSGHIADSKQSNSTDLSTPVNCEIHFHLNKIAIKIQDKRIEEYLLDGATIWAGKRIEHDK